jgi:alpha/beta superfamily hydrolase
MTFSAGVSLIPAIGKIRSVFLAGPAGRLEALLNEGNEDATHAALVCHPHPLYGGTMHNKVVFHAMRALNALGIPVLRFNFRGAGSSEGEHAGGRGEVDDVRAALDWLHGEFRLPMIFAGFSFGAAVGSKAACPDSRVDAVIALGLPLHITAEQAAQSGGPAEERRYEYRFLQNCFKPKLLISGARDPFAGRAALEAMVSALPEPKELVLIEGAGHFFEGHLDEMRDVLQTWTRRLILTAEKQP